MAEINQGNLRVFARLIKYGFDEEKKIFDMGIESLAHIPKITLRKSKGLPTCKERSEKRIFFPSS
ncbi:MAG: hypothetical protein IJ489_11995 [Clostridia bacterium]|nr:hypothetical protein [Clostridia bacterium]